MKFPCNLSTYESVDFPFARTLMTKQKWKNGQNSHFLITGNCANEQNPKNSCLNPTCYLEQLQNPKLYIKDGREKFQRKFSRNEEKNLDKIKILIDVLNLLHDSCIKKIIWWSIEWNLNELASVAVWKAIRIK